MFGAHLSIYKNKTKQIIMMEKEILKEITPIIAEKLGVNESEISLDTSFTQDLGADSLDTVELLVDFEKKYGISISDENQENILTVGDAIKYIIEQVS